MKAVKKTKTKTNKYGEKLEYNKKLRRWEIKSGH